MAQNEVSYFQFNFTWSISWRELINRNNLLTLQLVFALVTMMGTKTISTEYFASVDSCIYFSSRLNGQDQKNVPEKKQIYAQCLPKKLDPESVTIYQNWTRLMIIRTTNRIPHPFDYSYIEYAHTPMAHAWGRCCYFRGSLGEACKFYSGLSDKHWQWGSYPILRGNSEITHVLSLSLYW